MAGYQERINCSQEEKARGNYPSPLKLNLQYSDNSKEAISERVALHPEVIHFLAECIYEIRQAENGKRVD
jgi:hypothetical protein